MKTSLAIACSIILVLGAVAGVRAQSKVQPRSYTLRDLSRRTFAEDMRAYGRALEMQRYLNEKARKAEQERRDWDRKLKALRHFEEQNRRVNAQRREAAEKKLLFIGAGILLGLVSLLFGGTKTKS